MSKISESMTLRSFLSEMGLKEASIQQVSRAHPHLLSFASYLADPKLDVISCAKEYDLEAFTVTHLRDNLEVLAGVGSLTLHVPSEIPNWLQEIVRATPTIKKLQTLSFEKLASLDTGDCSLAPGLLTSMWCRDHLLRTVLNDEGVSLHLSDVLERSPYSLSKLSDLRRSHLDGLANANFPRVTKADVGALSRLYRENSDETRAEKAAESQALEERKIATASALARVKDLSEATRNKLKTPNEIKEALQSISAAVTSEGGNFCAVGAKFTTWGSGIVSDESAQNAVARALEDLKNMQAGLGKDVVVPSATADEELVATVGAAALHGIPFGMPLENMTRKAPCAVLDTPEYCKLLPPSTPFTVSTEELISDKCSANYRAVREAYGSGIASSMKANGWGFSLGSDGSSSELRSAETVAQTASKRTSHSIVETVEVPLRSFCITPPYMSLSHAAVTRARAIKTPMDAALFLQDFFSHVSYASFTLGGTFTRTITVEVASQSSVHSLSNKCQRELGLSATSSGLVWGASAEGEGSVASSSFEDKSDESSTQTMTKECRVRKTISAFGPPAVSSEAFITQLKSDKSTWRIIDRGDHRSLKPVWELMLDHAEPAVRSAAEPVRNAWLGMARSLVDIPAIRNEVERVESSKLFGPAEACHALNPPSGPTDQLGRPVDTAPLLSFVRDLANTISCSDGSKVGPEWENRAGAAWYQLFDVVQQWSCATHNMSLLPSLLAYDSPAGAALLFCAQHCVGASSSTHHPYPRVRAAIFANIDVRRQSELQQSSARLFSDARVLHFFKTRSSVMKDDAFAPAWVAPTVKSVSALISELRSLYSSVPAEPSIVQRDQLLERVARTLAWNIDENRNSPEYLQLRSFLANNYGFSGTSFDDPLTHKELGMMIEDIAGWSASSSRREVFEDDSDQPCEPSHDPKLRAFLSTRSISKFADMFLVDSPFGKGDGTERAEDPNCHQKLIRALVHKLGMPLEPITAACAEPRQIDDDSTVNEDELIDLDFDALDERAPAEGVQESISFPFARLCAFLSAHDEVIQHYVISALLSRRYAFPCLRIQKTALVNLETPLIGSTSNIAFDQSLPRLLVVSSLDFVPVRARQSCALLADVLGCATLTDVGVNEPTMELGFGWLPVPETEPPFPFIVCHAIGKSQYEAMRSSAERFFDIIFVELPSNEKHSRVKTGEGGLSRYIYFMNGEGFKHVKKGAKVDIVKGSVRDGAFKKQMTEWVKQCSLLPAQRPPLWDLFDSILVGECTKAEEDVRLFLSASHNLPTWRKDSLRLQTLLASEITEHRQSKNPWTPPVRRTCASRQEDAKKAERFKVTTSLVAEEAPLLKQFVRILSVPDATERVRAFIAFESALGAACRAYLSPLIEERDAARGALQRFVTQTTASAAAASGSDDATGKALKSLVESAELAVSNSALTADHLIREMAIMYSSMEQQARGCAAGGLLQRRETPNRYLEYPMMAAVHLLDGFPLELIDGESSWVNSLWLQGVMSSLNIAISRSRPDLRGREPRVFVISVLGVQKAGKSSLLNVLFGCHFRTSIERCTRGLNVQLLRCERAGCPFDYLLVLDTEGVRSPDLRHTSNAVVHDNRLAIFSMWLAHATLILVNGNQSNDMNDILSVVKYVSDRTTGSIASLSNRLFFAMRSVSKSNGKDSISNVRSVLHAAMIDALKSVGAATSSQLTTNLLTGFEADKDIFVLGNIAKSDRPPGDIPDIQYGLDASEIRERIHSRCCDSQDAGYVPITLSKWVELADRAQDEVLSLESELVHQSAAKRLVAQMLDEAFASLCREVSNAYLNAFEHVESNSVTMLEDCTKIARQNVRESDGNEMEKEILRLVIQRADSMASAVVARARDAFFREVAKPEFAELKEAFQTNCRSFLTHQQEASRARIAGLLQANVFFERRVEGYKRIFAARATEWCEANKGSTEDLRCVFDKLFDDVRQKALQECLPLSSQVEGRVASVFNRRTTQLVSVAPSDVSIGNHCHRYHEETLTQKIVHGIVEFFLKIMKRCVRGPEDVREVEGNVTEVLAETGSYLSKFAVYSDSAVDGAITKASEALSIRGEQRIAIVQNIMGGVKAQATDILKKKQLAWDEKNDVSAKLKQSRDQLFLYFEGVASGISAGEQFINFFSDALGRPLWNAYLEVLVKSAAGKVRDHDVRVGGFATSCRTLQNLADLDLIRSMNDDKALSRALKDPKNHYESVTEQHVAELIKEYFHNDELWLVMRTSIEQGFVSASACATELLDMSTSSVPPLRCEAFLNSLSRSLQAYPILLAALPTTGMFQMDNVNFDNLLVRLKELIPTSAPFSSPLGGSMPIFVAKKVLAYLWGLQSESFKIRCGALCPRCHVRCFHSEGHSGLHNTIHQPKGLAGVRDVPSNKLVFSCCRISASRKDVMVEEGTDNVSYRDFTKKYPSWETPDWQSGEPTNSLKVREYIFRNKQALLVDLYPSCTRCPEREIPTSYNHSLDDLRKAIEKDLGKIK